MKSYFLFNLCFVIYIVTLMLYAAQLFYKIESIAKIIKYLIIISFSIHTLGMIYKTVEAGHAPFVNMYETIVFFTWSVVLFYLLLEYKYKIKVLGLVIIPLVILGLAYSKTVSPEPEPLVPALQSIWLEIHIATSFIGYAAFAVAYGVGLMYLLKKPKEADKAPSKFTVFNIAFVTASLITFVMGVVINFIEKTTGRYIFSAVNVRGEKINEEAFGFASGSIYLVLTFFISIILIFLICYKLRERFSEKLISLFSELNLTCLGTTIVYYITIWILKSTNFLIKFSALQILILNTIICLVCFIILLTIFVIKREEIQSYFPDLNVLDAIIFIAISFGFPFLTSGIITGAIWANSAWGTYWGWDPKETWSLITWFVYAAYLHARYTRGWRDIKASYLAVYGFIAVIFTYFGVNLFFAGLHSYA